MEIEICDAEELARRRAITLDRRSGKTAIVATLLAASGTLVGIDDLVPELPKPRALKPNAFREAAAEKKRKKRAERNLRVVLAVKIS